MSRYLNIKARLATASPVHQWVDGDLRWAMALIDSVKNARCEHARANSDDPMAGESTCVDYEAENGEWEYCHPCRIKRECEK